MERFLYTSSEIKKSLPRFLHTSSILICKIFKYKRMIGYDIEGRVRHMKGFQERMKKFEDLRNRIGRKDKEEIRIMS